MDEVVLRALYSLDLHPKLNKFLRSYTRMGDGYGWGFILVYLVLTHPLMDLAVAFRRTAIVMLLCVPVYKFVKKRVKRPRPFALHDHVVAQIPPLDEYSFPSGHTMNNLAAAISVASVMPEIQTILIALPISWGLLRIYFGVHYISDVLAGIVLATLCALIGIQIDQFVGSLY